MMNNNEYESNANRAENRKKGKAAFIGRFFIAFFILLLLLFLVSRSPLFTISQIEVTGVQFYNNSQIVDKSGLSPGLNGFEILGYRNIYNLLTLRCTEAENNIAEACPYIKKVYAKFKMPDKILIEIEERSKSIIIPYQDFGLLLDEEGYVIDTIDKYYKTGLPIVKGISFDRYSLGKKLALDNDLCMESVIAIISALRQTDRDTEEKLSYVIDSIDVSDLKNIKLFIGNEFVVNLGDGSDIYYRINALKEIYYNGLTNGERGIIDFSLGSKPYFKPESV